MTLYQTITEQNNLRVAILIRQEKKSDFIDVFELNRLAFAQDNEAKLVDALRKNPCVFVPELSIVAMENDRIVGHIPFSKIAIKGDTGNMSESLALAPMAVRPDMQKSGIGSLLVTNGLQKARELGFRSAIVLGHEHYYPRFGFRPANLYQIKPPFDVPPNAFMAIELAPNGLHTASGTVIYPKEFETV